VGAPSPTDNGNIILFDGHSNLKILKYIKNIARIGLFSANQALQRESDFVSFFSPMTVVCKLGLFHSTNTMKYITIGPAVIDLVQFSRKLAPWLYFVGDMIIFDVIAGDNTATTLKVESSRSSSPRPLDYFTISQ